MYLNENTFAIRLKNTGEIEHKIFRDIVDYLNPGDCLVINDTKVIPARLIGEKEGTGAAIEVLLQNTSGIKWQRFVVV